MERNVDNTTEKASKVYYRPSGRMWANVQYPITGCHASGFDSFSNCD
jgi:hypothetical protein